MGVSYEVVFVNRPASPGRVQEILDKMDVDLSKLEKIEADYHRIGLDPTRDDDYQRLADRLRNSYYLAEDLAAQLPIEDDEDDEDWEVKTPVRLNGIDMAVKSRDPEFSAWAEEQERLSDLYWEK